MDRGQLSSRIAALRVECAAVGRALADGGRRLSAQECFEVAGELQGLVNAAEGAQAVAAAWGARVETTMRESGPWERVHPVGFVDAMAAAEVSLATGVTEGLAGRKAALGAALGERFPRVRELVLAGDLPVSSAHKVVDACAGLDVEACGRVDAELGPRLAAMDPARVTSVTRSVAARVAAGQVAAHAERARRGRSVQVRPGVDGLSEWYAALPTATSAAAWSAVDTLAAEYRGLDPGLSVPESRADAFGDLLLRTVQVTAQVTLGVPVVTGAPDPDPVATVRERIDRDDDDTVMDAVTGELTRFADLDPASREEMSWVELGPHPDGDIAAVLAPVGPGVAVSGTQLPGLGWVDATTVAGLLRTLPLDVARAVLDADTGTQVSHTTGAYRPPRSMRDFVTTRDGTCRMWGCTRAADHTDLDHTRPWPTGTTTPANLVALCRRHHRMKHHGRWRPTLTDDGTVTWTS
uniref:HNH endonuclease signature motif containing protein n=1 Tax=uncultured Phycicoccus sp. TaxID=661422 RepID=UPI0026041A4A